MKKKDLSKLALMGLSSGILVACGGAGDSDNTGGTEMTDTGGEVSEDALLAKLSDSSRALYDALDDDAKALVQKVAGTSCAGMNECAGLNGCKSAENECAGLAECKGHGGCAVDANMAVKLVVKKMAEERAKLSY